MNRTLLIAIAAGGSAAMMLGAFGFQFLGEMPPCKLCIYQRYGHVIAILAGLVAYMRPVNPVLWIGALGALSSSVIGAYHAGVELKWWEGPNTCTSGSIEGLTPEELLAQITAAPIVRCDEIPWEMFGISMAGWNAIASLGLALIWVLATRQR
ncbi:disulfide bond formation protein B [Pacificoceanicola onchidii]|uniref:disulfide bond formation protein B n=1 Tax=Pacificoceanicola onchidii TaxID=2562685 RepID=UPI0010A570DE|nr:disulfide bond formation protein B [Pacificoceanicola onchidii]